MHIYSVDEKLHIVMGNDEMRKYEDYLTFLRLFEYICQFRTYTMCSIDQAGNKSITSSDSLSAPGFVFSISHMELEIDGKKKKYEADPSCRSSQMDWLNEFIVFASGLENAKDAVLTVNYSYNRSPAEFLSTHPFQFYPANEFFDFGSYDTEIPENLRLYSRVLVSDVQDENSAYEFSYSGFGNTSISDKNAFLNASLEDVASISNWEGDYFVLGVKIPADLDPARLKEAEDAFRKFEKLYDESSQDLWDDLVEEYEGYIEGGGTAWFTATQASLPSFISDLKELNSLIRSLSPDAALIASGPLVSYDSKNPYAAIYFDVDDNGEIALTVMKLPEE